MGLSCRSLFLFDPAVLSLPCVSLAVSLISQRCLFVSFKLWEGGGVGWVGGATLFSAVSFFSVCGGGEGRGEEGGGGVFGFEEILLSIHPN